MTYDDNTNEFLIGNIGKNSPRDSKFSSSIVVLTEDLSVVKREILLESIFPNMTDIQGITINKNDSSIWFCSYGENMIRHISKYGDDMGYIKVNEPTGIAYSTENQSLFVLTTSELLNIKEDGKIIFRIPITIKGQDQICYDPENKKIYITAGINYQGKNCVYCLDLITKKIKKVFELADSNAIEGIVVFNDYMFIANDGYYHSAKNPNNIVAIYNLDHIRSL